MRLRVDVEVQGVAFLAPGAAGGEFGAVGHHHLDGVIVRVQVGFHGSSSCASCARGVTSGKSRGSIAQAVRGNKAQPDGNPAAGARLLPAARRGIVAPALARFGRGCRGPVEMNVAERDAARAVGAAGEQPQSAAAPAATPVQSRKLPPLISLMPYIARYRWRAITALVALLTAAVTTLVVPVAVRRMIDFGFSRESASLIDSYFAVMIAIVAVLALASAARFYLVTTLGERIVADLREGVFSHLVSLSLAYFDAAKTGELISRLTADTTQIKAAVGASVSVALRNLVLFFGATAMMVVTSPRLSAFVLAAIP